MSYVAGFYMITQRNGLTPIKFRIDGHQVMPTFSSYREASMFADDNVPRDVDYRVTEVAIGRA